jgi:hypothetical protein
MQFRSSIFIEHKGQRAAATNTRQSTLLNDIIAGIIIRNPRVHSADYAQVFKCFSIRHVLLNMVFQSFNEYKAINEE